MKRFVLFILFCLSSFILTARPGSSSLEIHNLTIYGESNLMSFWLKYKSQATHKLEKEDASCSGNDKSTFRRFEFPVNDFEANNRQIKADFTRMLKSNEFPQITICFRDSDFTERKDWEEEDSIQVKISIADVERSVWVDYRTVSTMDKKIYKGQAKLLLSDFNLEAPKRLFGWVKVKDAIIITFEMVVE